MLQLHRRKLYRPGRWGGMCLCPVYFLLSAIGIPQSPVDFVGRGGAVKRVSFAARGKAKDVELATTRFRAAVLPQDKELEQREKCHALGAEKLL